MPLRETEAIVLRTYRLGEAEKIASLFTRQLGRLRAVAKGAQRPKSRYGGSLEPLSYVRIEIYERENRDLLRLNSVEIIESFFSMQADYRVQLAAQFLAEVGERLLPEREVNERDVSPAAGRFAGIEIVGRSRSTVAVFRLLDGAVGRFPAAFRCLSLPAGGPRGGGRLLCTRVRNRCFAGIVSRPGNHGFQARRWPWWCCLPHAAR